MAGYKGGMGGGAGMQNLMKQAQKMQEEMRETEALLDDWEIVGTAGGEAVVVYMNAKKKIDGIESTTATRRRTRCLKRRWASSTSAAWEDFFKWKSLSNPSAGSSTSSPSSPAWGKRRRSAMPTASSP